MALIVGFGHRSGVGKDTAAKLLDTNLRVRIPGLKVKKVSFADKLKDIAYQLYGWAGVKRGVHYENRRQDREIVIPALNMTVVDLWVKLGEQIRVVYPMTWVHYLTEHSHDADVLIVPDVRHPNEVVAIQSKGGEVYKVTNPRVPHREGVSIDDYLEGFDKWNGEFLNSGSIDKLMNLMEGFCESLILRHGLKRE